MTDADAVLAANLEFYAGVRDPRYCCDGGDLGAARASRRLFIRAWPALIERDAILESWRGILANPEAPRIACYDERVLLYGDTALVLCEEELDGGTLSRQQPVCARGRRPGASRTTKPVSSWHGARQAGAPDARLPRRLN